MLKNFFTLPPHLLVATVAHPPCLGDLIVTVLAGLAEVFLLAKAHITSHVPLSSVMAPRRTVGHGTFKGHVCDNLIDALPANRVLGFIETWLMAKPGFGDE